MKNIIQRSFLISLFIIIINVPLVAQEDVSVAFAGIDTLIDQAIELVYQKKYDAAIVMCEDVIVKYPENPMGYLGKAAVYHILMLNYRVSLYETQFDSLLSLSIEKGEQAIKRNEKDANSYFVLGAAYGFRGLNRIRRGEWFGAFRDGLKGISNMKKAYEIDKELYDVYYGLGLYYYWKSSKAKVLTFLRLMKDEREKGIEFIKIAIEKGSFSSLEGRFALIEIYYYEDRYYEALNECYHLRKKFLEDPTWNYLTAKTLGKVHKWADAKTHFQKLLTLLNDSQYKSYSFLAECHYGIAECAYEMHDINEARRELATAMELSRHWDKEKEIEGPLLDFDLVLERMNKLNKELSELN